MRDGLYHEVNEQTLPFSRLAGRIVGHTKEGSGGVAGVGGTLRDLGNILGGD